MPHRIIWSWYTGRWLAGCYIWYSEEGTGRGRSPLLAVGLLNVTSYLSTASVPITVLLYNGPLLCGFNLSIKGLTSAEPAEWTFCRSARIDLKVLTSTAQNWFTTDMRVLIKQHLVCSEYSSAPYASLLKIAHWCHLPLRSKHGRHGRMLTWSFSRLGFPWLGLELRVPVT